MTWCNTPGASNLANLGIPCNSHTYDLSSRTFCTNVPHYRIGGLKEKILAAHRGGIKKVIIPKENEKDIKEIPHSILKQIEIILVEHMDDVLSNALILNEGDTLFKEDDISYQIMAEKPEERPALI